MSDDKTQLQDISHDAVFGWIVVAAGLALLGWGAVFDATMAADSLYGDRIINMGELAKKLMILGAGGFVVLIGTVVLAAYAIRSDLRKIGLRPAPSQRADE